MARGMRRGVYGSSLTGDWKKLGAAFAEISVRFPKAVDQALLEEAQFYRSKIVEGIREQSPGGIPFKPLAPLTLALRRAEGFRGTKALIRTGELRKSIVAERHGKDAVFVGILYNARGGDGRSLADIGWIHEFGASLRSSLTEKQKQMLAAKAREAGVSSGGSVIAVRRIPARPFIRPVIAMYGGQRGANRYMARVARKMGGLLGVVTHPDLKGRAVSTIPSRLVSGSRSRTRAPATTAVSRSVRAINRAARPKQKALLRHLTGKRSSVSSAKARAKVKRRK